MTNRIQVETKTLYGIQTTGPSSFNDVENSGTDFGKQSWMAFIGLLNENGIGLDGDMYGVSWPADGQTPPQTIHYFCGKELDGPVPGLEAFTLEGGNYFQYNASVPVERIDEGFQDAYMVAMPASGLTAREGQHIEIYGIEYDPMSDQATFRILIPVE